MQKKKFLKIGGALLAAGAIFGAGLYAGTKADQIHMPVYTVKEGFYQYPYDLAIERRNIGGEIEVYLTDEERGISHKIDGELHVGSGRHQLRGCLEIAGDKLDGGLEKAARIATIFRGVF